jgi:hypothetical protein
MQIIRNGKVVLEIGDSGKIVVYENLIEVQKGKFIVFEGDLELQKGNLHIEDGALKMWKGDLEIKDDLYVTGDLKVKGNVEIGGTLTVAGLVTIKDILQDVAGGSTMNTPTAPTEPITFPTLTDKPEGSAPASTKSGPLIS